MNLNRIAALVNETLLDMAEEYALLSEEQIFIKAIAEVVRAKVQDLKN